MIMPGAEPFFYPGVNGKGVLLIHGYTGTPAELKELGERLNAQGYTTMGVLLPGHGTSPEDLKNVTWQDWFFCVKKAYLKLERHCTETAVVGMSMGSLLTLLTAETFPVSKIVLMSTPIYLYDKRIPFINILKHFINSIKKRKRNIAAPKEYDVCYNIFPVSGVAEVVKLINYVKKDVLDNVKTPCLLIQSKSEHTVKPSSAQYLYEHIGSKIKKLYWSENSKHVLTLCEGRYEVYEVINDFLRR